MSKPNITDKELERLELESIKESIIMLKINENGLVDNRIIVNPKDIDHFKKLGYIDAREHDHNPQIGHPLDKNRYRKEILKDFTWFEKVKIYIKKKFAKKEPTWPKITS